MTPVEYIEKAKFQVEETQEWVVLVDDAIKAIALATNENLEQTLETLTESFSSLNEVFDKLDTK